MSLSDHDIATAFDAQFKPLLLKLYEEAELDVPERFDYQVETQRIVMSLREQGFSTKFKTKAGRELA